MDLIMNEEKKNIQNTTKKAWSIGVVVCSYLRKLNWYGFSIILLLCMGGAVANKNVNTISEWVILQLIFGLPFSLFFLFAGKKPYLPTIFRAELITKSKIDMKTGIELIAEERRRQIEVKGYTTEKDAEYINEELADGACMYAMSDSMRQFIQDEWGNDMDLHFWQFNIKNYKPTPDDRIKQLQKAGALIAAEIDRLNAL